MMDVGLNNHTWYGFAGPNTVFGSLWVAYGTHVTPRSRVSLELQPLTPKLKIRTVNPQASTAIHTALNIHIYVSVYIYVYVYICIYVYLYLCPCVYLHLYLYLYLYPYIHLYLYICIYILVPHCLRFLSVCGAFRGSNSPRV